MQRQLLVSYFVCWFLCKVSVVLWKHCCLFKNPNQFSIATLAQPIACVWCPANYRQGVFRKLVWKQSVFANQNGDANGVINAYFSCKCWSRLKLQFGHLWGKLFCLKRYTANWKCTFTTLLRSIFTRKHVKVNWQKCRVTTKTKTMKITLNKIFYFNKLFYFILKCFHHFSFSVSLDLC